MKLNIIETLRFVYQDQDSVGGGFSNKQAYTGKLYGVYVWKKVLSVSDIFSFASDCTVSLLVYFIVMPVFSLRIPAYATITFLDSSSHRRNRCR